MCEGKGGGRMRKTEDWKRLLIVDCRFPTKRLLRRRDCLPVVISKATV